MRAQIAGRRKRATPSSEAGFTLLELVVSLAIWTLFFATVAFALRQAAQSSSRLLGSLSGGARATELAARLQAEAQTAFAIDAPSDREIDFTTELGGVAGIGAQYWGYRWDGRGTLERLTSMHPLAEERDVRAQTLASDVVLFAVRDLAPDALHDPFLLAPSLKGRDARIPLREPASVAGNHVVELTVETRTGRTIVDLTPATMPTGVVVRADYICQARCRLNDCYALPTANPFINCKLFAGKSLHTCSWYVSWSPFLGLEAVYNFGGRDSVTATVPFAFGGPAYASFCDNVARQGLWYDNG